VETAGIPPEALPFTVIGGYLGAGKTTLVNQLLHDPATGRAAVLVNDFGDIDIDSLLIESHDGDTIALANGCVCCTLVDGLSATLSRIRDHAGDFDRVIVEVSGVGDPWKVAQWGRSPGFSLDAVVVLADAETVIERADDRYVGDTVRRQLAGADVVVITKPDLVDTARLDTVQEWLGSVCEARAVVDADTLTSLLSAGIATATEPLANPPGTTHADHVVVTREFHEPIGLETLNDLLASRPPQVMRIKGHVFVAGGDSRMVMVQVVGKRVEITGAAETGTEPTAVLVAVSKPGASLSELTAWIDGSGQSMCPGSAGRLENS